MAELVLEHSLNDWFIAFFYTGLGLALSLAGASYIARGVRGRAWAFHGTN